MADPTPPPDQTTTLTQYAPGIVQKMLGDPGSLDWQLNDGFVRRQQAIEEADWQAAISATANPAAGKDLSGQPTETPSALGAGMQAGGAAAQAGGQLAAEGIVELFQGSKEGPLDKLGRGATPNPIGSVKKILDGLAGYGLSPFIALGAGAGQALENANPELANSEFLPGATAYDIRRQGQAPDMFTPAQQAQMQRPMTVREALEIGVQVAPMLIGPAKKGLTKAAEINRFLGERGALGGPPEGGAPPPPEPSAPPASPFAQGPKPSRNLGRIGLEGDARDMMVEMNLKAQEAGVIKKEVISHATTASMAEAKDLTIERALKMDFSDLHANVTALRDLADHAWAQLRGLEVLSDGSPAAEKKLENAAIIATLLEAKASETGTALGRGLSAMNIVSDAARAYDKAEVAKLANQIRDGMLPGDSFTEMLRRLRTAEQRKTFLRQFISGANRGQNIFYEAWINGLLSNPVTHAANTAGNLTIAAWGVAERQMAGTFNVILSPVLPNPSGVRFGEATIMLRASLQAAKESTILAAKALRDNKDVFGTGKMEIPPSLTAANLGLSPDNALAGFVDFTGTGIRLPSRMLMTEDVWFKWFNYRIALEAKAYRDGKILGLSGDALGGYMRKVIAAGQVDLEPESVQYGLMQTFNNDLTKDTVAGKIGLAGRAVQQVPLARLILPFMKVPVNLTEYSWERTPVLSLIGQRLYSDLAAGGPARDLALARVGTSAMLAAIYMEYSRAGLMTGGGAPKTGAAADALRQLGRQDYAVRVGDDLYKINRLDPVGKTLGVMATYAEIAGQLPPDRRLEGAVAIAMAVSEGIKDQPYFMGLSTAIEAIQQPAGGRTTKVLEQFVPSLVPFSGLLHQTKKAGIPGLLEGDQTKRNTMALGEVEELLNMWKKDLPGFSADLPAARNYITGEPIVYPPGWGPDILSPVQVTALKNDPVFAAIAQNQPSLPKPPKALAGQTPNGLQMTQAQADQQGIPLTGKEYDRLVEIQTKEITDGNGRTLHEALSDLVQSEEFQNYPAGKQSGRARLMEKTYDVFHKAAIAQFREQHPQLDADIKAVMENRMRRRSDTGQPAPPGFQMAPGMTLPAATPSQTDAVNQILKTIGR